MTDKTESPSQLLVSQTSKDIAPKSFLIKRGLEEIKELTVSGKEIKEFKEKNKQFLGLSDELVRLAIEKPTFWEYLLYFKTINEQVNSYSNLKTIAELPFNPKENERMGWQPSYDWFCRKIDEMKANWGQAEEKLKDQDEAFGASGQPGSAPKIVLLAIKTALLYKELLDLSISFNSTPYDLTLDELIGAIKEQINAIAKQFEELGPKNIALIENLLKNPPKEKQVVNINIDLSLNYELIRPAMEKLKLHSLFESFNISSMGQELRNKKKKKQARTGR
jgi:hypothetical protein